MNGVPKFVFFSQILEPDVTETGPTVHCTTAEGTCNLVSRAAVTATRPSSFAALITQDPVIRKSREIIRGLHDDDDYVVPRPTFESNEAVRKRKV